MVSKVESISCPEGIKTNNTQKRPARKPSLRSKASHAQRDIDRHTLESLTLYWGDPNIQVEDHAPRGIRHTYHCMRNAVKTFPVCPKASHAPRGIKTKERETDAP